MARNSLQVQLSGKQPAACDGKRCAARTVVSITDAATDHDSYTKDNAHHTH